MKAARALPIAGYYALYFAAGGVLLPYLPAYFRSLGLSASQIGTLLALSPGLALVAPSFWGHLADRTGRPDRVLQAVSWGALFSFAPLGLLHSYGAIAALFAVYALFASSVTSLIDGIALHRVQAEGGSYSHLRLWGSGGFVCVAFAFGALAPGGTSTTVITAAALILGYALWSHTLHVSPAPATVAPEHESPLAGFRLLANPGIRFVLAGCALHWIACAPYHGMLALHVRALGLPSWLVGAASAIGVAAEMAVMAAYPRWAQRFSERQVLAVAFFASALRWAGMAAASSAPLILALSLLHGLTFGAFYIAGIGYVSRHVPSGLRARGQALFASVTFGVGGLLGYLCAGSGYDLLGGPGVFAAAALVELAAGACLWKV